ncbi:MAG: Sua5/YciO/YrdC/YwlC family protein [Bacteriovorax sp.]
MKIKPDDVFIYPTDTVWGIGCGLYSQNGHARIAEIKRVSKNKPLSIMFASARDVYESFEFPEEVSLAWLEEFFSLETTLGFPLSEAKIKIPKWATGNSEFASIRCLESVAVKSIYDELKTPFFSTSLNLTGEAPILSMEKAKQFKAQYASDALFFEPQTNESLSGSSSTIVFLSANLSFEIRREGKRAFDVKNHLMKLFC